MQCIGAFRRFFRVRWPSTFDSFLAIMELITPDIFDLVSFDCLIPGGLGYKWELVGTILLPCVPVLVLIFLAALVAPFTGRWSARDGVRGLVAAIAIWPQFWDLTVWAMLLVYPTLARKTLAIYDCVPYEVGAAPLTISLPLPLPLTLTKARPLPSTTATPTARRLTGIRVQPRRTRIHHHPRASSFASCGEEGGRKAWR
jgi:hypothetical protein